VKKEAHPEVSGPFGCGLTGFFISPEGELVSGNFVIDTIDYYRDDYKLTFDGEYFFCYI